MSLIKVDEAREIILGKIEVQGTEKISINDALGRVLAEDIVARRNNPPMDNSAM
ncbi:MAG: molybdopterin molybdenumtransferase MoeA, partial [Nitrospinae bacterium]|nr:molybdopterin molybdenumtransferase MoeA [Nitrospinota bacterium]